MEGAHITAVTGWQLTTQTYHTVRAKLFVDCSGDAILAPLTGAEFRMGREARAEYQESIARKSPMPAPWACRATSRRANTTRRNHLPRPPGRIPIMTRTCLMARMSTATVVGTVGSWDSGGGARR